MSHKHKRKHHSNKRRDNPSLVILDKYHVPDKYLIRHFTHAHGHGGQHVNKSATKVQLRLDIIELEKHLPFPSEIFEKLNESFPKGHIDTASQRTRHQHKNLEIAMEKLQNLIEEALN